MARQRLNRRSRRVNFERETEERKRRDSLPESCSSNTKLIGDTLKDAHVRVFNDEDLRPVNVNHRGRRHSQIENQQVQEVDAHYIDQEGREVSRQWLTVLVSL